MVEPSRNQELRDVAALLREAAERLERLASSPTSDVAVSEAEPAQPATGAVTASTASPFVDPGSPVPGLTQMLLAARRDLQDAEASLARHEAERMHAMEQREHALGHLDALENSWSERVALSDKTEEEELAAYRQEETAATQQMQHMTEKLDQISVRMADAHERAAALRSHIVALEAEVEQRRKQWTCSDAQVTDAPVRLLALRALDELRAPALSGLLGDYIHVRFGREVRSDRWGALRRDEQRSFESHQRRETSRQTAWLCPAIDPDDTTAVTSLWTRSDWPWSLRLLREDSDVLQLRLLYRLGQIALDPPPSTHDPDGLLELARSQLDRIRGRGYARTQLEEISERCEVIRHQLLEVASADGDTDSRTHDPAIDTPPDPPWLDAVLLPDDAVARLYGKGADVPF